MRILFCQTQFKLGGQQKVLLTLAKELNKTNEVVIYYENHNFFDFGNVKTIRPKKGTQIKNLFVSLLVNLMKGNFKKKLIADYWHLKNLHSTFDGDEFDCVVLLNPYILFVKDINNGIIKSKKVVCWTHNIYENYVNECFKYENDKLFESMKEADQVISLEKYTASQWKKVNPNTMVIHNPVTINSNGRKATFNNFSVGFVGRIQIDSKGLDYLCEVARLLPKNIKIKVAGSGSKSEEEKFEEMIVDKKIQTKIDWLGALNEKEMIEFYRNSSILVMTSRYEGFPLVAAEAMSFGLPLIAFDIPALQEVTKNGEFGKLVKLGDVKSMTEMITEVFNDGKIWDSYSKKSIKRANELDVSTIAKVWDKEVFKKVRAD